MHSVLIPFDGSQASVSALRMLTQRARGGELARIHVLNIQPSFSRYVAQFAGKRGIRDFQREEAETVLTKARAILSGTTVPCDTHWRSGDAAVEIVTAAREVDADEIVMAGEDDGVLSNLLARIL